MFKCKHEAYDEQQKFGNFDLIIKISILHFCRALQSLFLWTMDEQSQGMQGQPVPQFQPPVNVLL